MLDKLSLRAAPRAAKRARTSLRHQVPRALNAPRNSSKLTPMQVSARALWEARPTREQREASTDYRSVAKYRKLDWSKYPLGELPDSEVAKLAGATRQAVARARKTRGVAAYRKRAKGVRGNGEVKT